MKNLINGKWCSQVPRPVLEGEKLHEFIASWVEENFQDELREEFEDYDEDETPSVIDSFICQAIIDEWDGDDERTAENLIKYQYWSFSNAAKFYELGLYFDVIQHERKLSKQWIENNNYSFPFPIGAKVKCRRGEGIILDDPYNRHFPYGEVVVACDPNINGGYVLKWEDLILIEDE